MNSDIPTSSSEENRREKDPSGLLRQVNTTIEWKQEAISESEWLESFQLEEI